LRIHVLLPLTALVVFFAVESKLVEPSFSAGLNVAMWAIFVLTGSVLLHELARMATAARVGGHTSALILGPIGGLTKVHLPVDPPAHLVTALSGPMTYLVLLVVAGCGLAFSGDRDLFRLLLNPCSPPIGDPNAFVSAAGAGQLSSVGGIQVLSTWGLIAQLTVWVNWCLLLVSLLPIDPCDGAELLRGILWPMVGRSTATIATSRLALGGALFVALLALVIQDYSQVKIATWFPLSVISVFLLYGGSKSSSTRRYDVGLSIDEFDSDDEEWLLNDWEDEDREAVLVEHLQDKQQEAIDRKRREREANEDARVDVILIRLQSTSFDQLPEEDRATLKRASRRYRQRREDIRDDA